MQLLVPQNIRSNVPGAMASHAILAIPGDTSTRPSKHIAGNTHGATCPMNFLKRVSSNKSLTLRILQR
jgi:hypothetical protein